MTAMDKLDYYNTPEYKAFLEFASYLDHDEEMKEKRSFYRKKLKFFFRKAREDDQIKNNIQKKLSNLRCDCSQKSQIYFQECIDTFRMHYIEGKSIAGILAWYRQKENGVDLYESEIHRRIDYIVDLLMIEYLGIDGFFPGITNYCENSLGFDEIIKSYGL